MLRRWPSVACCTSGLAITGNNPLLTSYRTTSTKAGGNSTEGNNGNTFSFKRGVNAQRLSNAAQSPNEESNKPTVDSKTNTDSQFNSKASTDKPKSTTTQRAAFVGMLNKLSDRVDTRNQQSGGATDLRSSGQTDSKSAAQIESSNGDSFSSVSTSWNPITMFRNAAKYRPTLLFGTRRENIENERRKRLVFRDESSGALDRFNLFSDPTLFLKYLKMGSTFASDSELERRLRYYKEHASKEVLTSDGGKIMRGPPHLFPLRQQVVAVVAPSPSSATAERGNISGAAATTGIKGFVAASAAQVKPKLKVHPLLQNKKKNQPANKADSTFGATITEASTTTSSPQEEKEQLSPDGGASLESSYIPTANPNDVLRLPRIVTSQVSQFLPININSSTNRSKDKRINGAYQRSYLSHDDISKEKRMLQTDDGSSSTDPSMASSSPAKKSFMKNNTTQHVFTANNFRRPAMLVISQLGIRIGAEANNAWCCAALKYLEPSSPFIELFDESCNAGNVYGKVIRGKQDVVMAGSDATIREKKPSAGSLDDEMFIDGKLSPSIPTAAKSTTPPSATSLPQRRPLKRPVDLYCLRSLDLQPYTFMHRLYVNRFAQSLLSVGNKLEEINVRLETNKDANPKVSKSVVVLPSSSSSPLLFGSIESIATHNFVGTRLLATFFEEPFRLRNYIGTTVLLVDHCGRVRWVSGGKPDEQERQLLPKLLRDLEAEYLAALGNGSQKSS